jgi:Replication-relaxation
MPQGVILSNRDRELLSLLEMTPVTAAQIRKASVTFSEEPFRDERRVRERLQTLAESEYVQNYPAAIPGGGLMNYYRLTSAGYRMLHPDSTANPPRTLISEVAPSRLAHAMATAEIIVHTLVAAHSARVRVLKYHGDGKLTLSAGEYRQQPDCHFQLECSGKVFNLLFEVDNATEPLDSNREQSIRTKLLGYECYQDWVMRNWHDHGQVGERPAFRVVFLTKGVERARHILWLARVCARNPDRRLCYVATQETFLAEPWAVTAPIVNDHHGGWQSLVDLHPTSRYLREPIRLTPPLARAKFV